MNVDAVTRRAVDVGKSTAVIIEWEAEGSGSNTMNVTLKDPESDTVVNNIVDDSGTGQIGGANLVKGNMGTFFLLVEGPEEGWTVWIYQDFR